MDIIYIQIGLPILFFAILVYILFIKKREYKEHSHESSIKRGIFFLTVMSTSIISVILIQYNIHIFIYLLIWWFALVLPNIYIYNYFKNYKQWLEVFRKGMMYLTYLEYR